MIETITYLKVTLSSETPVTPGEVAAEVDEGLDRVGWLIGYKNIKVEPVNHADPRA